MLVVDGPQGRLLRQEPDGMLAAAADLTALGDDAQLAGAGGDVLEGASGR
jgi:hypothetical protein